ncbi:MULTISPECIES: cyclic peptide export ABC transporter [Thalassospira]|jgi:putative ATP-binding cassette transporter|nr:MULTISPECIES: cyclic peptide export ABC transporter [Thalassospira]MAL29142.1 peptide ABC transporter [Thalassospira sp.]MBL4840896.1 cyclic peptide export ABC transporter [Thalassospira sp.]OCK09821.1 cyclic peptide transporter [Thalassospira sp. KO164]PXX29431.1 putative ATP-binding cassette transporter [Thalassospira sp. 11-3]QPL34326.1 cyclic peptide export ABC transporter [Thalassospira sp. B30-1]|tara:strand:+ start:8205 stop:9854 length:1650 start_codon:yes stop_codon:yes gene_type:complete
MKLLELLSWGDNRLMARLAFAGALSGAGSAVLLGLVNTAAEGIADNGVDQVDWLLAGGFIALAVVYFLAEVFLLANISTQIEQGIDKVRRKLLGQIAHADFARLETFGQARLFDSITQSTQVISQNSHMIGMSFRSLLLVVAVMIYVFWLSTLAFFLIVMVIGAGIVIYLQMGKQLGMWFGKLHLAETSLFGKVADLFSGIREVRMWSSRSSTLFNAFSENSLTKEQITAETHSLMFRQMIMGMTAFYVLLAVIVFIVPVYTDNFGSTVSKVSTAVLFMIGPISTVVQAMAVLGAAEQAAARMVTLSQDLDEIAEPIDENGTKLPDTFSNIAFDDVCFTYPNRDPRHGFVLGPISLSVKKGELIFITGGNGAGKSTLIKLLTALYRPVSGAIRFDDIQLGAQNIASFRDKIATVFSDFHLFSELHGSAEIDPDEADYWLNLFELSHVTGIRDGKFVSIALSAGQRKRLGLITAILEHRPILVLDEWAADQDPYFRKKFYYEILPQIKARGITIIAVTHDDHYFDAADRRLHLESGTLHELDRNDPRGRI